MNDWQYGRIVRQNRRFDWRERNEERFRVYAGLPLALIGAIVAIAGAFPIGLVLAVIGLVVLWPAL